MRLCSFAVPFFLGAWGTLAAQTPAKAPPAGWPEYGGGFGAQRYSEAREITPGNVASLKAAWTIHTHALDQVSAFNAKAAFEATPVLWEGTLFFDTPYDQVFAIDAATGKQKWSFDPKVSREHLFIITSRGVTLWHATQAGQGQRTGPCADTAVLVATLDRRLIALDAGTGRPCPRFGHSGTVDLTQGVQLARPDLYFFSSPPAVVKNTIVLGSSVADNQQVFAGSGAVRGFDAVTGRQVWSWEPLPWSAAQHPRQSGSANAWSPLASDPEHDLVFIPTGSPSLDYYGQLRPGDNRDANSIVALRASTGEKLWAFQLVHHDLWDYDTASQPLLFTFHGTVPAVAVTNKTGMIYAFNRLTGAPLYAITERAVPPSNLIGEIASPTQPFSSLPPLQPLSYSEKDLAGPEADRSFCRKQIASLVYKGLFTPPSENGTLLFPAALGGPNWGSSAFDPASGVMFTRVSALPYRLKMQLARPNLLPFTSRMRRKLNQKVPSWLGGESASEHAIRTGPDALTSNAYRPPDVGLGDGDDSTMRGSPWSMQLRALVSPGGVPCGPEPFGRLVATDLNSGKQLWSVPHGEMVAGAKGSIGFGGPIVTAGGLVFVASTNDPFLRAYDERTGRELWRGTLPATANATPMTYEQNGRQYVVISVGGHRLAANDESDAVVAFALPEVAHKVTRSRQVP